MSRISEVVETQEENEIVPKKIIYDGTLVDEISNVTHEEKVLFVPAQEQT